MVVFLGICSDIKKLEVKHLSQQPKTDTDVDNLGVRIGSR